MHKQKYLGQFFTPAWAAEILFDTHFSYLKDGDLVWEPTCGTGNMLAAIPSHIRCIGTEIDPDLAIRAKTNSGRNVLIGSCIDIQFKELSEVKAVFGNPPFSFTLFDKLLERCSQILKIGYKAGFIIPAYFLQTSRTVMQLGRKWHIAHEIIPRDIFPGLSKPLIFGSFIRENNPRLIGFSLFSEAASIKELNEQTQELLATRIKGSRSVWRESVKAIISDLGGTASLKTIYSKMEGKRPTSNQYWKEQVRKICQQNFNRIEEGVYQLQAA